MARDVIHPSHDFGAMDYSCGLPVEKDCLRCGADSEGPPYGKATKPCRPRPEFLATQAAAEKQLRDAIPQEGELDAAGEEAPMSGLESLARAVLSLERSKNLIHTAKGGRPRNCIESCMACRAWRLALRGAGCDCQNPEPDPAGGWSEPDAHGGRSCRVEPVEPAPGDVDVGEEGDDVR